MSNSLNTIKIYYHFHPQLSPLRNHYSLYAYPPLQWPDDDLFDFRCELPLRNGTRWQTGICENVYSVALSTQGALAVVVVIVWARCLLHRKALSVELT